MIARTLSTINLSRVGILLSGFFSWWKKELEDLLPKGLISSLSPPGKILLIQMDGEAISLQVKTGQELQVQDQSFRADKVLKEGSQEAVFNKIPKDISKIIISVHPALLFKKKLKVPTANSSEIRKIVGLQIERLFPLEKDHLYFSASKPKNGQVTVFILKRDAIDPLIKALKRSSLNHKKISVTPSRTNEGNIFPIPLATPALSFGFLKNAFVFSFIFWVSIALGYFVYLDQVSASLDQEITGLQSAVSVEMATVSAYESTAIKGQAIAIELQKVPVLSFFDTLSEVFPDNSWIDDASISNNQIILSGTHPSPPDLVSALTATGTFQDVRLTSSEEISGVSRFQITLTIADSPQGTSQ